jgi:hypothetical protein
MTPALLLAAGVGCAVWASRVEDDAPGWRNHLGLVLIAAGVAAAVNETRKR